MAKLLAANRSGVSAAWFCFERCTLFCNNDPITAADCRAIWLALPSTGCAWIDGGCLFVQQHDGAPAWNCGPVADGVTRESFGWGQ